MDVLIACTTSVTVMLVIVLHIGFATKRVNELSKLKQLANRNPPE